MEGRPGESDEGYPEEQPQEVAGGGDTPQENREREGQGAGEATESGDGKATGNPRT